MHHSAGKWSSRQIFSLRHYRRFGFLVFSKTFRFLTLCWINSKRRSFLLSLQSRTLSLQCFLTLILIKRLNKLRLDLEIKIQKSKRMLLWYLLNAVWNSTSTVICGMPTTKQEDQFKQGVACTVGSTHDEQSLWPCSDGSRFFIKNNRCSYECSISRTTWWTDFHSMSRRKNWNLFWRQWIRNKWKKSTKCRLSWRVWIDFSSLGNELRAFVILREAYYGSSTALPRFNCNKQGWTSSKTTAKSLGKIKASRIFCEFVLFHFFQ